MWLSVPVKSAPFQKSLVAVADEGVLEDEAGNERAEREHASGISMTSGLSCGVCSP